MIFSFDPVRDAERFQEYLEREYARRMARMPYCSECGKRIETECFYKIGDEHYCEDCMDDHRFWTDDFLED